MGALRFVGGYYNTLTVTELVSLGGSFPTFTFALKIRMSPIRDWSIKALISDVIVVPLSFMTFVVPYLI